MMLLAIVTAALVLVGATAVYQWFRPPGGKSNAGEHDLTQAEAYGGVERLGKSSQYEPPGR